MTLRQAAFGEHLTENLPVWKNMFHLETLGCAAPGAAFGEHLTKKRTLEKKSPNCIFCAFLETKKMRGVRTIIFHQFSRRDLCYVSENKGFLF